MEKDLVKEAYKLMAEVLAENSAVAFENRTIDDIAETLECMGRESPHEEEGKLSINYFNLIVDVYNLDNLNAKIMYEKESVKKGFLKAGSINTGIGFVIKGTGGFNK